MRKLLLPALVIVLVLVILGQRQCASDREQAAKRQHDKTTDSITVLLVGAKARRDTLVKEVVVERVRIVQRAARVDTVKLGFARDSTTADSLSTALTVIAVQDSLIGEQAGHIRTLNEVIAADSGVARIFALQRATDSSRIVQLERPKGLRIPLLNLKLTCVGGAVVSVYPLQSPGVGVGCGVGL